ncbi:thiamine phosphate synthase [Rubrobacter calidifluminis]|uniref:thiamine phosphate synthase n=1 Tax=Rubrobacter calidifluminis TaxID=1392640 RepID=UPI0023616A4B|nr:thiamine phosphate synthase [Rubrobacter calidifluminis]
MKERLGSARLLLVTAPREDLVERVAAALRGGVDIVQLRDKEASREELLPLALELKELCERAGAIFTVNDDIELACESGAHGVHLGQEDAPISEARRVLGEAAIVGRSAGSLEEAREAVEEGADYLGAGAVYATPTKPEGEVAGLELVRRLASEGLPVPWFAIGGVTLETAPEVAEAGAPGFAVVRALMDAEDPEAAARELRSLLP